MLYVCKGLNMYIVKVFVTYYKIRVKNSVDLDGVCLDWICTRDFASVS